MLIKKVNLGFGLLLLFVFLWTGWFMKTHFKPENVADLVVRMEVRSNHIYILFIALLNIIAYKTDITKPSKPLRLLGYTNALFRVLLILSGSLAFLAFWTDHAGDLSNRKVTMYAVIASLVSIGLILIYEATLSFCSKFRFWQ